MSGCFRLIPKSQAPAGVLIKQKKSLAVVGDRFGRDGNRVSASPSRSLMVVFLWPSVFVDRQRLGFADFADLP
jgi:hypothetical protein